MNSNKGLFEIQDESSQRAALMVNPKPGQNVLDYCAGSGGKTLAFAGFPKGKRTDLPSRCAHVSF